MVGRKNVRSFPVLSFDETNLGEVETRLGVVAAGIASEEWAPLPHGECDRCPVQLVCPAWPQGVASYQS